MSQIPEGQGFFLSICSIYVLVRLITYWVQGLNVFLWLVAFGVGLAVVYGLNIPKIFGFGYPEAEPLSKYQNIFYGGFHRLAWALAVSWVIFACCRGYGGKKQTNIFVTASQPKITF